MYISTFYILRHIYQDIPMMLDLAAINTNIYFPFFGISHINNKLWLLFKSLNQIVAWMKDSPIATEVLVVLQ